MRDELAPLLGPDGVLEHPAQRRTYAADGLAALREVPPLVLLPSSTEEAAACVRACRRHGVPFVPRGAGSGLSGGAMPHPDGVLIGVARLRRILDVDLANGRMTVEPGVTNREISAAVEGHDRYYAPDPSSQIVCTIGGNVAENSGGVHCLKYGFTTNHVLALELITAEGEVEWLGAPTADSVGYDLRGLIVGSEGTLGLVTKVVVRLLRTPESVRTLVADFTTPRDAGDAVTAITASGIVPAGLEMLDHLAIQACEEDTGVGLNRDAGAVLLVELDGPEAEVDREFEAVQACCREAGATAITIARDAADRARIWKGRKAAFAAMGRLAPDYFVQDGVIPRTALGDVLERIADLSSEAGYRVANVFHAGDGNLHPLVLYDGTRPGEAEEAEKVAARIVELCVDAGGSITGEHGVGADKACSMPAMFGEEDLAVFERVRRALDPDGLANPDKVLPTPRLCGESPGPYRPHPLEEAGLAERL
ncbi:FAD-binding protein [Egibacter rhizosphaerae]|uniref:FAD-binding protein n=1 Tax=Egibacter rhizosphaerae TaxID=1670831 RepID=A0A411YLS5_9ACTN|nr:FAD-binding protein [Egibacter rhizosphaerae]